MEILKNFVFDLQRHSADEVTGSVSGPSSEGTLYYEVGADSKTITGSGVSTPPLNRHLLIKVTLEGTTYTIDAVSTSGVSSVASGTFATSSGVSFTSGDLEFTSNIADATLKFGSSASAVADKIKIGMSSGSSVTWGNNKLTAAGESAVFTATTSAEVTPTIVSGAAYLNYNGSTSGVLTTKQTETVIATSGSIVVSYDGKISALDAKDTFTSSAGGIKTYTVGDYGEHIVATSGDDVVKEYLLTNDVSSVVGTLSGSSAIETFSNTIAVTASGGALNGAGGTSGTIKFSTEGNTYAYLKNGEVIWSGYRNDSFGKALGAVSADNDGNYMFDGSAATIAETIVGGADEIATIISGSASDFINVSNNTKTAVTVNSGDGNDSIEAAVFTGASIVSGTGNDSVNAVVNGTAATVDLGDGNNILVGTSGTTGTEWTITSGAGNDTINLSNLANGNFSYWNINVGDGNNTIEAGAKTTFSTIVSGSGNDTITSYADSNSLVGGSGSDVFRIDGNGKAANISDYEYGNDALYVTSATDANANVIAGSVTANGVVTDSNTTGQATISGSNGVFAATITDANNNKVDIGWTGENGTSIDASSATRKAILVGTTNEVGDTLVGGSKADTIYAGASDSVYGGAGNDLISINDTKTYGVYVGFSTAGGKDTVQNFSTGWDIASADEVYVLDENSIANLQGGVTGNNVTLKSGTATMTLSNAANGKSEVQALVNDKKVDLLKENTIINVTDDSTLADYYIGTTKSGISLKNYTSDVEVNLSNAMFRNITTLEGGAGSTSILGGKAAESLKGGTGDSSLYGGAGVDTLVSGDGKTTFFATSESGRDVVTGFVVGTDDTSDVLNVSSIAGVTRSNGTNFTLKVDNSNSLNVSQKSGGVNSNIQWVSGETSGVAKIGITGSNNNFSYDTETTNYVGGNKVDTVSLTSGTTDNFNVWLDQTGGMFSSIEVYDMKNTSGSVLMAGKADTSETIIGGQSNTSLWGGAGNTADVLKSTSGSTTDFFYGLGDGNDSISGSAKDTVNLYNINLSDITKADINSNSVVFTTTANNTVSVSGGVGTFKLADGTAWTANYSSRTWSAAE